MRLSIVPELLSVALGGALRGAAHSKLQLQKHNQVRYERGAELQQRSRVDTGHGTVLMLLGSLLLYPSHLVSSSIGIRQLSYLLRRLTVYHAITSAVGKDMVTK
jgi:hypothetical protein